MRPSMIVVIDTNVELRSGVIETEEQALIEQFVAQPAVEAFAKAILHRLAGRDEMPNDLVVLRP